ncbi:uncharacterized protein TM35_000061770 [Trypanosoma theileri]|uniref:Dynactin subunit 6 n=1 Tax=Trypanosoma theileri TaxID=67003 RepID=A0A1X0P2N1_9TRYP|nr:uncharacterized protein TM35_000061770 [Trypanosoma theileri]ORC91172.1 hypothetical protein TM35_000061770 [Trypanosoma theileri]
MNETQQQECISPFAVVRGSHPVKFSIGCVVHPFAVIVAQRGPINFGAYCIIEEHACIINSSGNYDEGEELVQEGTPPQLMSIGSYNHFKAFSHVANISCIGQGNCFEPHCHIEGSREAVVNSSASNCIGDYSVIGAFVHINMQDCSSHRKYEGTTVPCDFLAIPSRMVLLSSRPTEKYCDCCSHCCKTDCFFSHSWELPRGELFDEEVEEEILRKKCSYLCEVVER